MASTVFSNGTVVQPAWLNDVNTVAYGSGANVKTAPYNAKGDGVTDDYAAIQAALTANKVVFLPSGTYRTSARLQVPAGRTIYGTGQSAIKLLDGTADHILSFANGASHVNVYDLELDGNKANNPGGGIGIACSSLGAGVSYVNIRGCYIHDCGADGVRFFGSPVNYINVYGCTFEANTTAGLTSDNTIQYFTWHGNISRFNGTHGIGIIGTGLDGTISSNVGIDNGQAIPNADNFTGYFSGNSRLSIVGNTSVGGLNNGIHFGGDNVTYSGNMVSGALFYGIVHQSSGTTPGTSNSVVITGNSVIGCQGAAGIAISYANSGSVTGNTVLSTIGDGILAIDCANTTISGNTSRANSGSGIRTQTIATNMSITGNICTDNAIDGIRLGYLATSVVSGNVCKTNATYGLSQLGTDTVNIYANNIFINNTVLDITGTFDLNSVFSNNTTSLTNTVAAAATLALPSYTDVFQITGTTTISNIGLSWLGRVIKLCFTSPLTVTEANNLEMAGNFSATATGTITFVCRGPKWAEVSRSAN